MSESQTPTPGRRSRFFTHFSGASPVLRVFARLAVISLLLGWVFLALMIGGIDRSWFASGILAWHLAAFVAGLSSFSPLGGIAGLLAALTLFGCLFYAAGGLAIP